VAGPRRTHTGFLAHPRLGSPASSHPTATQTKPAPPDTLRTAPDAKTDNHLSRPPDRPNDAKPLTQAVAQLLLVRPVDWPSPGLSAVRTHPTAQRSNLAGRAGYALANPELDERQLLMAMLDHHPDLRSSARDCRATSPQNSMPT